MQDDDPLPPSRLDWSLWRRIVRFGRPYRRHVAGVALLGVAVGALDVLLPLFTGKLIDHVGAAGRGARLGPYAALYGALVAAFVATVFGFIVLAGRVTTGVAHDVRHACFDKLQRLPFAFYDRKAVGWLMARLTSDCSTLSRVMGWAMLDLAWGTFVLASSAVVMLALNWRLALLVLAIVPPLALVTRCFQRRLLLTSRAVRKANSIATAAFNEAIAGARTTKSLVREAQNLEEFAGLTGAMYGHAVSNALCAALFLPLVASVCSVAVALALWRGGIDVAGGAISLGVLVAFLQYAAFLVNPVQEMANMLTMVQGAQASAERINSLLSEPDRIEDSPEVQARVARAQGSGSRVQDPPAAPAAPPAPLSAPPRLPVSAPSPVAPDGLPARIHTLEFRDVTFAYDDGRKVLEGFNLTVRSGQTIALVGPTGGGKTTIASLACRFYEPTAGQVLLDGLDYRRRPLRWYQSQLGMVLQQPHLFSGTVRENIRYGRLSATDAEVERAARLAHAHDFILSLPKGYDAPVGEGGDRLSTGQKQLVSLARALLADPQLVVLDEATSSVDAQAERLIQSAVDRVLHGRISFVIAHRLSTVRRAHRILFIEDGRIAEEGTHHDLLALRGKYRDLCARRFTHEREEAVLAG